MPVASHAPPLTPRERAFAVALFLAGLGFLINLALALEWRRAISSLDWPTARGKVSASELIQDDEGYQVRVNYRYSINDWEYTGTRLNFFGPLMDLDNAQILLERYPPEARVTVYYDASNPWNAVLEPGAAGDSILNGPFTLGTILLIIGALQLVQVRREGPFW